MSPKTKCRKVSDYVPMTSLVNIGSRLNLFVQNWQDITSDTLSVVRNVFQISILDSFPGVLQEVTKPLLKVEVLNGIFQEIDTLVLKGTIIQVEDSPELCLSPIFSSPST